MYFITTVIYNTRIDRVQSRCWGLFPSLEVAEGVIYRDRGDFYEMFYPYLVIEEIKEDVIDPKVREVKWYEFNEQKMEWVLCERPDALAHISGFSLNN